MMKPGRNDLCPCGSGKKYKKCCALMEEDGLDVHSFEEQDFEENDASDIYGMQETLLNVMMSFRKLALNRKPHIKEYYKVRRLHGEIVNAMAQYQEDGKFEQKVDKGYASQNKHSDAIYLLKSGFDLSTQAGRQGFYDILIYKAAENINCITEDFIQKHRYRKPEKIEFLHSMLDSRLGLFEITGIDSEEGYAYLKEVFTGDEHKIVDVGLSGDENFNEFYLYTRIIAYRGISFNTGLNLVFTKKDEFIRKHIAKQKKDYSPSGEFTRFFQLYNQYVTAPDNVKIVTNSQK